METTITLKVEIEGGERLTTSALQWVKFQLTKEFVQILNDTVPGQITLDNFGVDRDKKLVLVEDGSIDRTLKYKISPLLKNRTILDFLR
jgi:hypothetical protein